MGLSVPALARRTFAEPLTQFLLIGAVIFGGAEAWKAYQRPTLRIGRSEITQLAAYWQAQMQREPTKAELDGLVRERIDEEILSAEAKRLGMDKDDLIIRRRLAQKMAFATEDISDAKEPGEAALRDWYAAHPQDYQTPAHMALRQVFFSDDRGAGARPQAEAGLIALQAGGSATGDPSLLPLTYAEVSLDALAKDYGDDFAKLASEAPQGVWQGPVHSGFGWHLLRVENRQASVIAPFGQVRGDIRDAVLAERRKRANAAYLTKLRRRYRVEVAS